MKQLSAESVAALMTCHREAPDPALVADVLGHLSRVLVVADGLPERHARALDHLSARPGVGVLRIPERGGKGSAIAAGLAALKGSAGVLVLDGDGQHPPEATPSFLAAAGRADLVIGDRLGDPAGIPLERLLANRISSRLVSVTSGVQVPDSQCGMRLLSGRALSEVAFPTGGLEAETYHLKRCLRAGVPVTWVPIPAIYDGTPSSFRTVRDSVGILRAAVCG